MTDGFAPAPLTRYVAFLRAINVGGRTVKMDALRRIIAISPLGVSDVETFIASGNLIFQGMTQDTRALEGHIEEHLLASFGYPVETFIRTTAEVAAIASQQPFPEHPGTGLYVAFLKAPPDAATRERLFALEDTVNQFHIHPPHDREVYWRIHGKMSDSTITGAHLERALGAPATVRNTTTIRRIAAKYPTDESD